MRLVIAFVVALVACGSSHDTANDDSDDSASAGFCEQASSDEILGAYEILCACWNAQNPDVTIDDCETEARDMLDGATCSACASSIPACPDQLRACAAGAALPEDSACAIECDFPSNP